MKISSLNFLNVFAFLLVSSSVMFVSCKGKLDLKGTWSPTIEVTNDDVSDEEKAMAETMTKNFKFTFKDEGKVDLSMMGQTMEGTYVHNKDKGVLVVTIDGDPQEFTIKGNKFEAEENGVKMIFSKN